ncbi:putative cell wall binding repeat 2-containing protein [Actinacidiphila reveromycinica]|uniref:Putative cell wall binding repeat 2-containing protein n=1 Tax=Actinacidiphila reveromycinica TaxID=659352 RepID=A0A7U3VM14_9ACTN|nr:putative cell wall binding repeat 2-containing protein [Streptomyces sp. SN-593]
MLGPVVAVAALAVVAAGAPAAVADGGSGGTAVAPQRIGTAPALPHGAVRTSAPDGGTPIDLGVELAPRDPAALRTFIADVSTPGSPLYHHYLKTGQYKTEFGPSAATVNRVRAALTAQGLTVGTLSADGTTLPVHTTLATAAKALHTGFTGFRAPDGRRGILNTSAPALPADAAPAVTGVTGLDTLAHLSPHLSSHVRKAAASTAGASTAGAQAVTPRVTGTTPSLCTATKSGLSAAGYTDTQDYWSARSLATAYGMADQPDVGTGVSVGIFELENYGPQDIAAYQSCYGTKVSVSAVKVDGGPTAPADTTDAYGSAVGMESALDIEDLIGLVPQASLVVYEGPDAAGASDQNVLDVYQKMVTDNKVKVISTSWGACTADQSRAYLDAENQIFAEAAAQGQTVTAASGDDGSGDCWYDVNGDGTNDDPNGGRVAVDDPAGQPYVLGVGGTTMTGSNATQRVWNSEGGATGGGVSSYFQMDSASGYQSGRRGPGYFDACSAGTDQDCRQVPDVAALADPDHGYLVEWGEASKNQVDAGWYVIGGTSGASPTWAALAAQADLDLGCAADGPIGFANTALYRLPSSAFHDVVDGNNIVPGQNVLPAGLYTAGTGYDLTTGLGTPQNARTAIAALCKATSTTVGGTFTPVNPARVLDTRAAIGVATTTPVAPGGKVVLQVAGSAGGAVPSFGVTSVVLNVTATAETTGGHLIAYPDGGTEPTSSNLNWTPGRNIPNLVIVPVGDDGRIDLVNASSGTVHFVADAFGYFSTDPSGATYYPVGPARVLDTRSKIGVTTTTPVKANGTVALKVAGAGGVPASGATAVVLNVTATGEQAAGHLIAYPGGTTRPDSSNLNWIAGKSVPNLVIVPVGADGTVDLYNASSGTTHFVADVFGYYRADAGGALFHPAAPVRLLDTRTGTGAPSIGKLSSTGSLALSLADGGALAGAKAVVLNVTVVNGTTGGVLTVWPDGQARPTSSNLNWSAGQTIANLVTVPVVDGKIDFHASAGSVDVVADLFGYYA